MDVNALRAMVQRLNPERKDNPHRDLWFKPQEEATVLRVLPNPNMSEDLPFFEVYFHYDIAGERSIVCPKQVDGSPCPVCELADDFRARSGKGRDDPNWQIFTQIQAKPRVYTPVLIRGREEEGAKLWGFPGSILQYFTETILDEDYGDFTHPVTGRDVTVKLLKPGTNGNPGKYPRPAAKVKPAQTPIFKDKEQIKELLASIPNYFDMDPPLFEVKSHDELVTIVRRYAAEQDGEGTTISASDDLPTFGDDDFSDSSASKKSTSNLSDLDSLLD